MAERTGPIKSGKYTGGALLGHIEYQRLRYEVYLSECEEAILYRILVESMVEKFWSTKLKYMSKTANSFCRDAWKLLEAYRDPSVSPHSKAG